MAQFSFRNPQSTIAAMVLLRVILFRRTLHSSSLSLSSIISIPHVHVHAFSTLHVNVNVNVPSIRRRIHPNSNSLGVDAINHMERRSTRTSTRLQSIESRHLRFYNSSPILDEARAYSHALLSNGNDTSFAAGVGAAATMVLQEEKVEEDEDEDNSRHGFGGEEEHDDLNLSAGSVTNGSGNVGQTLPNSFGLDLAGTTRAAATASSSAMPMPRSRSSSDHNLIGARLNFGTDSFSSSASSFCTSTDDKNHNAIVNPINARRNSHDYENTNYTRRNIRGPRIHLSNEEQELFNLLTEVIHESKITSTLRVAGGWVRDKLLATEAFQRGSQGGSAGAADGSVDRLTSKFKGPSSGRQGTKIIGGSSSSNARSNGDGTPVSLVEPKDAPVDIDIALDDMLGREFADHLNEWLTQHGREKITVGMVLKNPEKSKHLETATMKVGSFWIDFVNLRAEEYTEDSRIPDMMRIGTAEEDAFRRDLTINSLFYNINTGEIEDLTGRGFDDLKRGIIATPLPALTTLLDDPLRVLRSVRFAARLRFTMDDTLKNAAMDERVRIALAQKVARERVGSEVDLMLRSQDPVGAMRLLINLNLVSTVFPIGNSNSAGASKKNSNGQHGGSDNHDFHKTVFDDGLHVLSTTHNHLCDCKVNIPIWCEKKRVSAAATNGVHEMTLVDDDESRRRLWYASFLKPLRDHFQQAGQVEQVKASRRQGKKASRSVIMKLMVDELKRPLRDAEAVESIMKAADDFTNLLNAGCDFSAMSCLLGDIRVVYHGGDGDGNGGYDQITCHMGQRDIDSETEDDPLWQHAMELRLLVSKVLERVGPLWRAAMILSLSEQLATLENEQFSYTIEGDVFEESQGEMREGIIQKYDSFAAALMQLGLVGIWSQEPLIDGREMTTDGILPNIPKGPVFREIMDEQLNWMTTHPGATKEGLIRHLRDVFSEYV